MDKTAQTRSITNKIREKLNVPKSYLERFFQPELKQAMDKIVQVDDIIRAELTGTKIGKALPSEKISAKDLVKSSRSHFNRREFMQGVTDLAQFRKKLITVVQTIKSIDIGSFGLDFEKIHHKYLFDEFPEKSLQQLKQNVQLKAELLSEELVKEAGIFDVVHNVATSKGRALSAWEKQNQKITEKLRKGGLKVIDTAQDTLSKIISELKSMARLRAVRNPHEYVKTANNIVSHFGVFDTAFTTYYNTIVDPFVKKHEAFVAAEKAKQDAELARQTAPTIQSPMAQMPGAMRRPMPFPPANVPPMRGSGLTALPPQFTAELDLPPVAKPTPSVEQEPIIPHEEVPKTVIDYVNELNARKKSYSDFMESLQTFSNEGPNFLASYILKYAKSIQDDDFETAVKLFNIVKQIRG
jgi:hypothetical protein